MMDFYHFFHPFDNCVFMVNPVLGTVLNAGDTVGNKTDKKNYHFHAGGEAHR